MIKNFFCYIWSGLKAIWFWIVGHPAELTYWFEGTEFKVQVRKFKEIKPKITAVEQTALPTMTPAELQEEFDIKPNYVQNEEQDDTTIWNKIKYTKYKNRLATDDEYRLRIEKRIDELMGQLERNEIKLEDLTNEDQKVILDILNQNA